MMAANTSYKCSSAQDSLISFWIILEIFFSPGYLSLPVLTPNPSHWVIWREIKQQNRVFSPHIAVRTQSRGADLKTGSVKFISCRSNPVPSPSSPWVSCFLFHSSQFLSRGSPSARIRFFFSYLVGGKEVSSLLFLFAKSQKPCLVVPTFCTRDIVPKGLLKNTCGCSILDKTDSILAQALKCF